MGGKRTLANPRPNLGFAAHACEQAPTGDNRVLILDRAGSGKNFVEIWDENLPLPDFRAHLTELAEKLSADEVAGPTTRGVGLGFVIGPDHRPASCRAAWMDAHVNAV